LVTQPDAGGKNGDQDSGLKNTFRHKVGRKPLIFKFVVGKSFP
jgi:hypothetical protein